MTTQEQVKQVWVCDDCYVVLGREPRARQHEAVTRHRCQLYELKPLGIRPGPAQFGRAPVSGARVRDGDCDLYLDHMDFPPNFENGPAPLGSDY